jgi:DNA repair exonuclease SbcCD ATPase subunit
MRFFCTCRAGCVLLAALCATVGCQSRWLNPVNPELRDCQAERRRLAAELAEVRGLRDQYRQELEKARGPAELPAGPVVGAGAPGSADMERQVEEARAGQRHALAEAATARQTAAAAQARVAGLEREIADLRGQVARLEQALETAWQQRAAAEQRALAADTAVAEAARARAATAEVQRQLEAAVAERQRLILELADLQRRVGNRDPDSP